MKRIGCLVCVLAMLGCGDDGSGGSGAGASAGGGAGGGGATTGGGGTGGTTTVGGGGAGAGGFGGSGGVGGVGGAIGGGGSGAGPAVAECAEDADCKLVDNCCECSGIPNAAAEEACDLACVISACTAVGPADPPTARCSAGQCVTSFACDGAQTICLTPKPECPPGQQPTVVNGCWGGCLPERECADVTACEDCSSDSTCVSLIAHNPSYHCVDPGPCDTVNCKCLAAAACVDPFTICSEDPAGISCGCPVCL